MKWPGKKEAFQIVKAVTFCGAYLIETLLLLVYSAFASHHICSCPITFALKPARHQTMWILCAHILNNGTTTKCVKDKSSP